MAIFPAYTQDFGEVVIGSPKWNSHCAYVISNWELYVTVGKLEFDETRDVLRMGMKAL